MRIRRTKADALFSQFIRNRDKCCQRCMKTDGLLRLRMPPVNAAGRTTMACEQRSPPTLGMGSAHHAIVDSGANNGPICANGGPSA